MTSRVSGAAAAVAASGRLPVKLIAAVARNRVIGKDGKLPWSIPEDWQYFKDSIAGGVLVFGNNQPSNP